MPVRLVCSHLARCSGAVPPRLEVGSRASRAGPSVSRSRLCAPAVVDLLARLLLGNPVAGWRAWVLSGPRRSSSSARTCHARRSSTWRAP